MGADAPTTAPATPPTSAPAVPAPAAQPAAPAQDKAPPGPVPYDVFKSTNEQLAETKRQLEAAQAELGQYGKSKVEELNSTVEATRAAAKAERTLVKAGANENYLDYLVGRYNALPAKDRPAIDAWAKDLAKSEPAFFGQAAGSASSSPTTPTAPKTNPNAGALPAPAATVDAPITDELIAAMDAKTYARRKPEITAYMRTRGQSR